MIVARGNFKHEYRGIILYSIDERLTDGNVELRYSWISDVKRYSKRKESYQFEVNKRSMVVRPTIKREINEYVKYIDVFFDENIGMVKSTEQMLFECNFKDNKIICYDFARETVNDLIEQLNITEEELVKMLMDKSISGYK